MDTIFSEKSSLKQTDPDQDRFARDDPDLEQNAA
jgi:hypothetical protein